MKYKSTIVLTLASFLMLGLSANAIAANSILTTKSFQWVRGQLWVYGPDAIQSSNPGLELVQQIGAVNVDAIKDNKDAKTSPEELTKALQKATLQKL